MQLVNAAVSDPHGVTWMVRRKWMYAPDTWGDSDGVVGAIFAIVSLLVLLAWPIWFAAKFLGVPWKIVIERAGREVGTERVRGWRASGRRIDQIRQSILGAGVSHYR
ncbi:hypothetical protein A5719_04295 [Mycolicibacterium peregrinum]|uniref:hypothetical protein n=1 Tax=Mycolicibacterium peregrinum TaxID=43304 RepID=UPI0007EB07F4|nr:hypothetical protein [Mycolicibacterium peregrinum]OBF32199.1 hypothetical protein A5719_04295 [Mycolicibacterium peregrinum]